MPAVLREDVASLAARPRAQVLVIGGGINGLGILRDLSLQGVDAALVEAADYASGTTAASSHMIHGGIRYLENGEFRLVRESVRERDDLLRTAPHRVRPLRTTIPLERVLSGLIPAALRFLRIVPGARGRRGALLVWVGLRLYELFSQPRPGMPPGRVRRRGPRDGFAPWVRYLAEYSDASVHDPERLAIEVLLTARSGQFPARSANYVRAIGWADGAVVLRDESTGVEFPFAADVIVNATGPAGDLTNAALGNPTRYFGGTKGSHVVVDDPALLAATGGGEVFFEHRDGRIVLIYPIGDRVLIGTTDIPHDPATPALCTDEEVEYFERLVEHVLPATPLRPERIVYRYSGVRPLPRSDGTPGSISRDYRLVEDEIGGVPLLTVVGGKWTTFRALGEHVTDRVLRRLGRTRIASTRGRTIAGGHAYPSSAAGRERWLARHSRGESERASRLLDRYGARALELLRRPGWETPLEAAHDFSRAEIEWLVDREFVVHLSDLLQRRTDLAFRGAATPAVAAQFAEILGDRLGWSTIRRRQEIRDALSAVAGPAAAPAR